MLQNKIYRLQKKINTNKINTKDKIETQECMEQYLNSTDHFLPAPLVEFVKTQVRLHQQKKKGRKYTVEFKEFCIFLLYFL